MGKHEIAVLEAVGYPGSIPLTTDWHVNTHGRPNATEREKMMDEVVANSKFGKFGMDSNVYGFMARLALLGWKLVGTNSVINSEGSGEEKVIKVYYQYIFEREIEDS